MVGPGYCKYKIAKDREAILSSLSFAKEILCLRNYFVAMQEISTFTSLGRRLTSTVSRAGGLLVK